MIKRLVTALLLTACAAWAQDDEEWASAIGQKDQVTKGLVSYWSMRTSGTTMLDEIGSKTGSIGNVNFYYYTGVVGVGAEFDGDTDAITLASVLTYAANNTTAFWIRPASFGSGNGNVIINFALSDSNLGITLTTNGTVDVIVGADGAGHIRSADRMLSIGVWTHVAIVRTGLVLYFYKNGSLFSSSTFGAGAPTLQIAAIGNSTSLRGWLNGWMDEVRIYNRAITSDEVKQLYRMGKVIYENR